MSFNKKKYIALGIISFILIGIGFYFLFIKKKHYDCTKDPNCKSPSGCVNNACITGMSCQGNSCTPYTCTEDNCSEDENKHCKGNVCLPKNYKCTDQGSDATCTKVNGSINANCYKDTCYNAYYNLSDEYFRAGCQSQEPPGPGESANDIDLNEDNKVQKYCNNNPNCIGFYQQSMSSSNVATDIIPENCTDHLNDIKKYNLIYYKQKVS